jgi:hypothetical protein
MIFFSIVANEVNDNGNPMHHFLRECKDQMIKPEYDSYLNDEEMHNNEHPSGILNTAVTYLMVKLMIEQMTKVHVMLLHLHSSGFHCDDPMKYVDKGIKNAKMNGIVPPIVAYYFHMQCRFNDDVNSGIVAELPPHALKSAGPTLAATNNSNEKQKEKDNIDTDNFETIADSIRDFNTIYENTENEKLICAKQKAGLKDLSEEIALLENQVTEKEKNLMQMYALRFTITDEIGKAAVESDYQIKVNEIKNIQANITAKRETKKRYQSEFLQGPKSKKGASIAGIESVDVLLAGDVARQDTTN